MSESKQYKTRARDLHRQVSLQSFYGLNTVL